MLISFVVWPLMNLVIKNGHVKISTGPLNWDLIY